MTRGTAKPLQQVDGFVAKSGVVKRRDPTQPDLPFDPMPDRIEPALALLKSAPPTGQNWAFEVKWDGYRLAVHIDRNGVRIVTRGGHDWTHRFPTIAATARNLNVDTAILDGEAVVVDAQGHSDFGALQQSLGGRGGKRISTESVFYAFDLLYLDGHDFTSTELSVRRHLLEGLLSGNDDAVRLSEEVFGDGAELLANARELGLEGLIAKDRDSHYRSGRKGDWLKIKCIQSESFMIVGYEQSMSARGGIGSLLLAAQKDDAWVYVGEVGTGFKQQDAIDLKIQLDALKVAKPILPLKGKHRVFVQPKLIAEIEFSSWTNDGHLRHASYKGLRDERDNAAIFDLSNR